MTRDDLLEQLTVERFGPVPRTRSRHPTAAEIAEFEAEHERAAQRTRRDQLAGDGVADGPDPIDQAELLERPSGGIAAA